MTSSNRKIFALMAIGMSKEGDMRDPRDIYQNQLVPMVVEQTNRGERAYDIYSRLLERNTSRFPSSDSQLPGTVAARQPV